MEKLFILLFVLALGAGCNRQPSLVALPSSNQPAPNSSVPQNGAEVTLTGETVCLPHKEKGDFQTLECALGFKDTAGNNYAVRGAPIDWQGTQITGIFINDTSGLYDVVGVIDWKQ
jgi:hypothetical protein